MSRFPRKSPWGEVQRCEQMIDGVFLVTTADHGGIMVRKAAAGFLSPDARKIALKERSYLCFEIGCGESVVIRELLDKKLWQIPDRIPDKAKFKQDINRSLQKRQPEYWASRQKRLSLPERLSDGASKAATHNAPARQTDNLEAR